MNDPKLYTSAKKDFRRRLLLRFVTLLSLILAAYAFRVHQYGMETVPHVFVPLMLLPVWLWAMFGFGSAFGAALYADAFRCPRCGNLYSGGLSLLRYRKPGCCASCGLHLFQKKGINWRLE